MLWKFEAWRICRCGAATCRHPLRACCAPPPPARRGGLVGPWTAVAPLMALCTDPHEDVRGRALRMLRQLCEK